VSQSAINSISLDFNSSILECRRIADESSRSTTESIFGLESAQMMPRVVDRSLYPRVACPETVTLLRRPLLRATVSFSSSCFAIIIRAAARKSMETKEVGERWKETKSRRGPCFRAMPLGWIEREEKREREQGRMARVGIGRIVLIKQPRNVGRWLNPVIDLEARAPRERRAGEIFKFLHYSLKESLMPDGIARNIIILLF